MDSEVVFPKQLLKSQVRGKRLIEQPSAWCYMLRGYFRDAAYWAASYFLNITILSYTLLALKMFTSDLAPGSKRQINGIYGS